MVILQSEQHTGCALGGECCCFVIMARVCLLRLGLFPFMTEAKITFQIIIIIILAKQNSKTNIFIQNQITIKTHSCRFYVVLVLQQQGCAFCFHFHL